MSTFDVSSTGLDRAVRSLDAMGDDAVKRVAGALYLEANAIFNESQRLVPIQTGTLKSSGHIDGPNIVGGEAEVSVGYGGAASGYALFVHEIVENHHAFPTQAKFLEQPLMERLDGLADRLARRLMA